LGDAFLSLAFLFFFLEVIFFEGGGLLSPEEEVASESFLELSESGMTTTSLARFVVFLGSLPGWSALLGWSWVIQA
jgi:hypothetical protein